MAARKTTNKTTETKKKEPTPEELGFEGVQADETPNENYTVAGVVAGKPVPETQAELRRKGRMSHRRD